MRFLLAILFLLIASPGWAQQGQGISKAMVVSSCGGGALPSGALTQLTMNTAGQLCIGATAGVLSVWSAADAALNGMTLSNGGLTVTGSGATGWKSVRTSVSKSSGKVYVEFLSTIAVTGNFPYLGSADATFNPASFLGNNGHSAGSTFGDNQVIGGFTANYALPTTVSSSAGDVWAIAIDFTAGSLWFALNNVWYSASNPATGSLPILSFVPATVGALFPGISFYGPNPGVWTLQATAAAQKYAAPSGFKAWDAP